MKKTLLIAGVSMLFMSLIGCAALPTRSGFYEMEGPYPSTRVDALFIHAAATDGPLPVYGLNEPRSKLNNMMTGLIFFLDVPFSVVTDTLLLPWDVFKLVFLSGDSDDDSQNVGTH